MNIFFINILKFVLRVIYAPIKLFKTKNRIVYLSRQSNTKSLDMELLEQAIIEEDPSVEQVFRLKMIADSFAAKFKYCFTLIGDMYYIATSKVAILDTYSIPISCLKHKKTLTVVQLWHALGAIKKFGLQSLDRENGRSKAISKAMCMHKNYDYILAPSPATAKFYMEGFGYEANKIKICPMPRVDFLLNCQPRSTEFFSLNPGMADRKIVLYLPTFRDKDKYIAEELKVEFQGKSDYQLIVSAHPLSTIKRDEKFSYNGDFSAIDLMKIADIIITDYSACAFEAALLMKPLYFFVPDYEEYEVKRGLNVKLTEELPNYVFFDAEKLLKNIDSQPYDICELYKFKDKYIKAKDPNNAQKLAKFILMLTNKKGE